MAEKKNHILVGLGGTGGKVLKAFKKRLWKEYPDEKARMSLDVPIGFLYVDSTREMMKPGDPTFRVLGHDASFTESEFVDIKSVDLNQILSNIDSFPGLKPLVGNGASMKTSLGEVGAAAGQKRRAGRILFAANINKYLSALKAQYQRLKAQSGIEGLHIHIFTGLAGGTGSGSVVDAVAQARMAYPHAIIDVCAMVPELDIPVGCQAGRYHQNGYAALRELSAMNVSRYLPCNVLTGEPHVVFDEIPNKQFGLMLYSNVNENGVVVNSFTELPQLLADSVYFTIFMKEKSGVNDQLLRAWSCENFNDFLVEYDTKSKSSDPVRARTKGCSSFGIKRIIYPQTRIKEHISYSVASKLVLQMQYNNFKDDFGYVEEAVRTDYSEYTREGDVKSKLKEWLLDESHLTLNEKILDTDRKVEDIRNFWDNISAFYSYDEAKAADRNPLRYIQTFCEEKYKNQFRLNQGVEGYYADKSADAVLKEQASFIVDAIEKSLYTQWYEGRYSMNDLLNICNQILAYIRQLSDRLDEDRTKLEERIKELQDEADGNMYDWEHTGLIMKAVGKRADFFAEHQDILRDLYVARTQRVAKDFEGKLLSRLRALFEEFAQQVALFIGKLAFSQETLVARISDRTRPQGDVMDLKNAVVEVSEDEKMVKFERVLTLDRTQMETLSGILRKGLAGNRTFARFDELARSIDEDTVCDLADRYLEEQVVAYHDNNFQNDKIVGLNVLQQLQKVLVTDVDIQKFAQDIIAQSGVYLKLNDGELNRAMNNNENPVAHPECVNHKHILVTMPKSEGDDRLKDFADKLKNAIASCFGNATPGSLLMFDLEGEHAEEITVMVVKSCFPIRALDWLPTFKREYDALLNNPNEQARRQAQVLLHSEGNGDHLPLLEGEGDGPKGDALLPYFFLAAGTDRLKVAENEREEKGWCVVTEDMWGIPTATLISPAFTGIPTSEELTGDIVNTLVDGVDEYLRNPELKMSERTAVMDKIKLLMRDFVAKETSGPASPTFKKFADAAMKAMEMITKK